MVSFRRNLPSALRLLKLPASCGAMWNRDFRGAGFRYFAGSWAIRFIFKLWNISVWFHARARSGSIPNACVLPPLAGFLSKGRVEAQGSRKLGLIWTGLEESIIMPGYPYELQTSCSTKVSHLPLIKEHFIDIKAIQKQRCHILYRRLLFSFIIWE